MPHVGRRRFPARMRGSRRPRTSQALERRTETLTLHRQQILHQTSLSGGGLDFYAQKQVVMRTRGRPSRQWVYTDDTVQRIKLAQQFGALGISLDDAAAALNGATLEQIHEGLSTHPADRIGEWVSAIIAGATAAP